MKRIELFEFEDMAWLPNAIRTGVTKLIAVLHNLLGTSEVIANLILTIRKQAHFDQIVDLGSGSGGAMLDVIARINKDLDANQQIKLLCTDLHPNPEFITEIETQNLPNVDYSRESVDASDFSNTPSGLKTMVNSFHHMRPELAKKILKSAEENKQPILVYEMGENFVPTLLWWLLLPISLLILVLMVFIMTPFVKKLNLKQILFTYLIPVIPLIYAWDGQASTMRTYTIDDVHELIGTFDNNSYSWEVKQAQKVNGKKLGYYILGYPVKH